MKYRREIDGLRALALISVIIFHTGSRYLPGGFVGVDIFFVISGFLITTIILSEKEAGSFSLLRFYERRIRRIIPALFFVISICLPVAWFLLSPKELNSFAQSLIAVSTFTSNIFFWRTLDYFDQVADLKPLIHTWTLAVEEQFYLILPLLILGISRLKRYWAPLIIIAICCFSIGTADYYSITNESTVFFLLHTRIWELLSGSLISYYMLRYEKKFPSLANQSLSLLGIVMMAISLATFTKHTPHPSLYTLIPVIGAALVIIYAKPNTLVARFLSNKILVGIGLVSYSAYLWHQPIFAFTRHYYIEEPNSFVFLILSIITFILSYFSWRYIEKPFRDRTIIRPKKLYTIAILGTIFFTTLGIVGDKTKGFLDIKLQKEQRLLLRSAKSNPRREECHATRRYFISPKNSCEYNTGKLAWSVIGDSHAPELAYALAEELTDGTKVKHFSFSGCAPTYGRTPSKGERECSSWTDQVVKYIAENPQITNVVISYRINFHLYGGHEEIYPEIPNGRSEPTRAKVWSSYIKMAQFLSDKGKKVFIVLQTPELPRPIEYLIYRAKPPFEIIKGVSRDWWNRRGSFVQARLSQIPPQISVIDPANLVCDDTLCYATKGELSYYYDDEHLSIEGAKLVVKEILKIRNSQLEGNNDASIEAALNSAIK